jgi:tetratricopeptide (TPR) repeat protein
VPYEAEKYYSQTAEVYSSRFQYESATPAWTNLSILFSEQGRHAESLELHEKVLRVRENAVGTFLLRIAMVHNNIACAYRRMGALDKALESVDRAIAMFPTTDGEQAGAYSTRAMILRDAGSDAEAVEWFQKAFLARMEQASPDLARAANETPTSRDWMASTSFRTAGMRRSLPESFLCFPPKARSTITIP